MSYNSSDVPKRFYLAIHFYDDDDKIGDTVKNLLNGELKGVKGIAGSGLKDMVKEWGNMRELMISMPSEDLLKLNKLSRVMYKNPEYLVSKGMAALRRLFNETGEKYSSIFTKMQKYLMYAIDDPSIKYKIDYYGAISRLDKYVEELHKINDIKDLVNFIITHIDENCKELKELGFAWWRKVVMKGLEKMGELYSSEKEWLIKGDSLKIPKSSRIYIVEPSHLKREYEKSFSQDKALQFFVDKKYVERYKKWLGLVNELKKNYRVEIVPDKYVDTKKYELVKIARERGES
jgi:hypothetical protein